MTMKEEEQLEFMSNVGIEDNDMNGGNYVDPLGPDRSDSVIGHWILNQSKHPTTLFFHLFFKAVALWLYIFGSWVTSSFIFVFVLCIIFLAFDFWVVKNVSGRLLVGLRWWSTVREDGTSEWTFETLEDTSEISSVDSTMFWGALYICPALWVLMLVVGMLRLKFEYMPIVLAALGMSGANIIGYFKCSNSAKKRVESMMEQGMKQGAVAAALDNSTFRNWALNTLLAVTTSNTSSSQGNNSSQ